MRFHEGKEKSMLALARLGQVSHLTGTHFHVDLGHVGHAPQALHAVPLPGPHRLRQDLELQVLPLAQNLALHLNIHTDTHNVTKKEINRGKSKMVDFGVALFALFIMRFGILKSLAQVGNMSMVYYSSLYISLLLLN